MQALQFFRLQSCMYIIAFGSCMLCVVHDLVVLNMLDTLLLSKTHGFPADSPSVQKVSWNSEKPLMPGNNYMYRFTPR